MRDLGSAVAEAHREDVTGVAQRETETVERTGPFRWLVRAGFVARSITYGVIGGLALAIALGAGTMGAAPSQQGALALIARSPLGRAALVVICVGLLAYALWKFTQGIRGCGPEGGGGLRLRDRVANLAGGAVYLGFFAVAIRALIGSSGNSSAEPSQAASGILGWPGGQVMVAVGGAGLIAISLYQLYDAFRGGFARHTKTARMVVPERRLFMVFGRIGLTARSVVFALIGYFLMRTAIEFNAGDTVGVDGALARLHAEPLGRWLVGVVALGLLIFAAFSLLEGRHRRL